MFKKIVTNLISSILIFIIATSSILVIYVAIFVDDKSVFGYRIFNVVSDSMSPTIVKGELLLTKKATQEELQIDTLISFISSAEDIKGEVNTHRIVRIEGDTYYTKGDANDYIDKSSVHFNDIIGRVIWHSDFIGKFIGWAKKPNNMMVIIGLTVIFAFVDVGSTIGKLKRVFGKQAEKRIIIKRVRVAIKGKRWFVLSSFKV